MVTRLIAIVAVLAALGFGGYIWWQDQNDRAPTPQEQAAAAGDNLKDALQNLKEAATDVTAAAQKQAAQAISDSTASAQANVENAAAQAANAAAEKLTNLQTTLESQGILTEEGIDYARAREVVEGMDLTQQVKAQTLDILQKVQNSPTVAKAQLDALIDRLQAQD
ncbi:hypothetical protein [Chachezhania sediminis]|uniref:hypothetical protein n=1 Tax=Chachezhania sediminis TaxID=2599291 RepID=UPI00131B5179|nr:hypothetical protein [Chachezhania sediminis]